MGKLKLFKIYTLADNLVMSPRFQGQWGLSMLLEVEDWKGKSHKIIFDTGGDKRSLTHNIETLKVDLEDIDCIILSHGHGDHTSSTVEIASSTGGVRVYAHPHLFLPRFYIDSHGRKERGGVPEDEGLDKIERAGGRWSSQRSRWRSYQDAGSLVRYREPPSKMSHLPWMVGEGSS